MDVLRRQRGTVKAKLTRLEGKIGGREAEQQDSTDQIEVYISRLEEIYSEFSNFQRKIVGSEVPPTTADATEDEEFEDRYLKLKIQLKQRLRSLSTLQDEERSSPREDALTRVLQQQAELIQQIGSNAGGGSQASTTNSDAITQLVMQQTELLRRFTDGGNSVNESKVRLPVVKIPIFDGHTEDWKRFSETFQSLIHNNESIPQVQKFQYLITSLSGGAAKIIESIELTNENYAIAWSLLTKRYDDPRAIKKKHIQCLFAMPRVEKESSSAIRELVDYALKHLRILKSMNLPTDTWHELIVHMIESKLDAITLRAWEQEGNSASGKLDDLTDFLQTRCHIIERIEARTKQKDVMGKGESDKQQSKSHSRSKTMQSEKSATLTTSTNVGKCYLCQGEHFLYRCEKFIVMPVESRIKEVQRMKLCINCLRNDHFVKTCRMGSCRECSERHNTLLHLPTNDNEKMKEKGSADHTGSSFSNKSSNVSVHHASKGPKKQHVIMATAIVNAARPNGSNVTIRILLDSASEANFVTQTASNKLGVKRDRTSEIVTGLNEMESKICQSCDIVVQSRHSNYQVNVHCLVVPTITKKLPSFEMDRNAMKIPSNIKLADFDFHKPNSIDMLVGAEFFFEFLEAEKIKLGDNCPILQNTKLGWVIAGLIGTAHTTSLICSRDTIATLNCSLDHDETLNKGLEKFWELENCQSEANRILSADERQCEEIFNRTTTRDISGRFVVRLPFRGDSSQLGESRDIAIKRLAQLERRFKKNEILQKRYIKFMREYQELGHMSPVADTSSKIENRPIVYLPHHGVIKESSTSTKLRTVFDASSKTDSGIALNDLLHVGPTLQSSLIEIVIRFRFHNIALTGDLRKMYRQIIVHPDDRDYQRILWRETSDESIQEFQLNTVTYGEASSSYLAIKCIRKLAEQAENEYPIATRVVLDEMYVDDIMTGADNEQGIIEVQQQLTALLQAGGFVIHKWCSNCPGSLAQVPQELRETVGMHSIDANDTIKTLGLEWRPIDDKFQFSGQRIEAAVTKRQILSAITKFFDPLGLIGPILTTAKLLMQETWRTKYDWDEVLPATFVRKWERFRHELNDVETISIPRRVISCDKTKGIFLQGFCDASEVAYGACLYIQAENETGVLTSRLLCSKSRVAPIKATSIPRLELCSAVLLTRLIANVQRGLRIQIDGLQAWTDSMVALCWIRGDASRWKTFVANRVTEIVETVPAQYWDHVRGEENPADLISRGTTPRQLSDSDLWWSGPQWLKQKLPAPHSKVECEASIKNTELIEVEERKTIPICNFVRGEQQTIKEIIDKFSTLTKIDRVLGFCLRFISNLKKRSFNRNIGRLSTVELQEAHRCIVKYVQASQFAEEISALQTGRNLKVSSKIIQLHPFLDDQDVLRVGGRLQHASLSLERKHPIILPAGNRFSKLLFEREHRRLLHASQLLLLSSIRERYWPLKGKDLARQTCHACVWCARNNPRNSSQIMGSLPNERVCPSRAFTVTGVDFAGPIATLVNKGRGRKQNKSYIALFVCFSTKAIHLEATSDLTTAAFIGALRRFIGRRGRPRTLFSDNGTNLVGANRELKEVYRFVKSQIESGVGDSFANENIEWKFIPPSAPHMGGLWEAGVKSCKYYLKRVMGNSLFTFEELSTALIQIEACLNSRPLSSLSADPMDLQPLTPAHFLIGESLTNLPDNDITEVPMNRLSRWQMIQRALQDFWKRWAAEYISTLQGRAKWRTTRENLKVDEFVVVREENLPPLKWKLGRVVELHPGKDGFVRVVTVRTSGGNIKRPITKLCKLPVSSDCDEKIDCANLVGGMSRTIVQNE